MPFIQDNSVQPLNPQERKAATAAKKAGGFFQRLGEDLNKRKQNVMSDAKEFSQGKISSQEYRVRGAGQVAGGFTDVVGNVVGTAAKAGFKALPQQRQEALKSDAAAIAQSKFGQAIGKTASSVASKYGQFRESNPRLAKDIEAAGNIASAVPIGFGTKQVGSQALKTAQYVGEETGTGVRRMLTGSLENNVGKAVGMTGRMGLADTEKAIPRAVNAFRTIAKNAKNTMVKDIDGIEKVFEPTKATFGETLQALKQTKDGLYNQWTKMAKEAGEQGVSFGAQDFQKAIESLRKSTANSTTAWRNKAETLIGDMTRNYADETPNGVVFREVDPSDIQKFIENINVDINPMSDKAGSEVSSLLSRTLREMMDKKIESTGPGYQALRNQYSDLKSVENGLINQFKKSARGVGNGFPQWVEGFGTLDAIVGMVTQGPQAAIRGVGLNILAKTMRSLRDPENALKRSFKEILRETNPMNKPAVIKGLESLKGKGGLNLNDVSGGKKGYSSSLLQEAGTPIYHGTPYKFDTFKEQPTFFSRDKAFAENIASEQTDNIINKLQTETRPDGSSYYPEVMERVLRDEKIFDINNGNHFKLLSDKLPNEVTVMNPYLGGSRKISKSEFLKALKEDPKNTWDLMEGTARDTIKKEGFDGWSAMEKGRESIGIFNPNKLSLYNKAQGGAESPLLQEAGKYKSAEEFVKAQALPESRFEYHLSTDGKLPEGKTFGDLPRSSEAGIRGGSGDEVFSSKNPAIWHSQLGYEGLGKTPDNVYLVEVKNPQTTKMQVEGGIPKSLQTSNLPSDIRIVKNLGKVDGSFDAGLFEFKKEKALTDLYNKAQGGVKNSKFIKSIGDYAKENVGKVKVNGKIPKRILDEMADFTTYAAEHVKKGKELVLDEIRARKIAEKLRINPDISNIELAKKFGKILENNNWQPK